MPRQDRDFHKLARLIANPSGSLCVISGHFVDQIPSIWSGVL
jgi:hypothetical protein